jgi:peptide/nickel transport system ATP-binding protein
MLAEPTAMQTGTAMGTCLGSSVQSMLVLDGSIFAMNTGILSADRITLMYPGMVEPALQSVSLQIEAGISIGIVGESGSGKSSLARCLLGLEEVQSGRIEYKGRDVQDFTAIERREFRRNVQMVFQDPYNSLNPRMTIGQILSEVLKVNRLADSSQISERVNELLNQVGLHSGVTGRYPHELSGGQRQRVGIARALSQKPAIIIADEPVSALDVSVQAQILNLLKELIASSGITLVLIAHDLAIVRYICPRIAVMRKGIIVEEGNTQDVITSPNDSYTRSLISAVPDIDRLMEAGHL